MKENNTIELNGEKLIPRELTVDEVEQVLESLEGQDIHILETVCPEEPIPALAAALSVGVNDPDYLKGLFASDIKELFKQVRLKNSFLAEKVELLSAVAKRAMAAELAANEIQDEPSTTSADQSAG